MHKGRLLHNASNRCSDLFNERYFGQVRFEKNYQDSKGLTGINRPPTSAAAALRLNYNEINCATRLFSKSRFSATTNLKVKFDRTIFNESGEKIVKMKQTDRGYATTSATASTVLQEMPESRGLPLIGTTWAIIRAGGASKLHQYVDKRHKELGPVYREQMGSVKAVFVSCPNEYRRIFRLEGSRPKHLLPESWILYNEMRRCQRGLFFMKSSSELNPDLMCFKLSNGKTMSRLNCLLDFYVEISKTLYLLVKYDRSDSKNHSRRPGIPVNLNYKPVYLVAYMAREGDEWLHFRRIMNKLLLKHDSDNFMIGPCKEAAKALSNDWNSYAKKGEVIPELEKKLYQWSIEVMLAILVGETWPKHRSDILSKSEELASNLHKIFDYSGQLSLLPVKLAMNLNLPLWKRFVTAVDNALEIVRELVKEMMKLEDVNGLIKVFTNEGMQDDDLVRIVADLILAAGDTTAYSMQWGLFLLANHPRVQEELFENLQNLNEKKTTQQPLLKAVIKETLRLYPTAPFLTRILPEDSIVGGYRVAKGELILMSLYTSGHDEKNFENAESFSPERWFRNETGEYTGVSNPHATLPFALGARSCVGRKIAETQLTLTMAELIKNFKMECINREEVEMILHLVSVPSQPIKLVLTSRY